ncbi:UNVERIFIED_CONTAM: hypothetical protein NCL1_39078 [Trichonephila clavipes]
MKENRESNNKEDLQKVKRTMVVVHVLLLTGKSSFVFKYHETTSSFIGRKKIKLSDLSDDNNAANKSYESRIQEGESNSDESDEENMGIFEMERQFWIILYHKKIVEVLYASPSTNKSILTDDEDNSVREVIG